MQVVVHSCIVQASLERWILANGSVKVKGTVVPENIDLSMPFLFRLYYSNCRLQFQSRAFLFRADSPVSDAGPFQRSFYKLKVPLKTVYCRFQCKRKIANVQVQLLIMLCNF